MGMRLYSSMILTRIPSQERHATSMSASRLGPHEITRQWCSEHIRHRQLRVAVLHAATHLLNRVTGEHSHENGGGGLAASGSSDEQAAAAHCEGEQRHQHEGGV